MNRRIGLAAVFITLFLCGASAQQSAVNVFAAASLMNALQDIDATFSKSTGIKVLSRFEASSFLARRLESSSGSAVFISADPQWMDYAETYSRMDRNTRVDLLSNRLVLIAPRSSPIDTVVIANGFDLASLVGDGGVAVADVNSVPAGIYAKSALMSLGAWAAVEPKLKQAENVRAALAFVAQGAVSVGIVFETDAKVEPVVKIIGTFPENSLSERPRLLVGQFVEDDFGLGHWALLLGGKSIAGNGCQCVGVPGGQPAMFPGPPRGITQKPRSLEKPAVSGAVAELRG